MFNKQSMEANNLSEFNGVLDAIQDSNNISATLAGDTGQKIEVEENKIEVVRGVPFDLNVFAQEVYDKSHYKNKGHADNAVNMNAYDIAVNCSRQIVYKLLKTPVPSFADKWLPIVFRAQLGKACHDFVQLQSDQFTEAEVSLKIPSIRLSVRLDNLIGYNVLVEIKSCTYSDYQRIIRNQKPRRDDFMQSMVYKHVLENHLAEAKDPTIKVRSNKPALDEYKIDTIQFIYLAHDITASDVEDVSEALMLIAKIKKQLKSKNNPFFFMTSLVVDTNAFDQAPFMDFIKGKIESINSHFEARKLPAADDEYIVKSKCFFCRYYSVCDIPVKRR